MGTLIAKFNSAVAWPLRLLLVAGAGLSLLYVGLHLAPTLWAAGVKLSGGAPHCPWPQILTLQRDLLRFSETSETVQPILRVEDYDATYGIERIAHPARSFWIRRTGESRDGLALLAYLIAEHEWMAAQTPEAMVRKGDIVLDCGAHIGAFTHQALERGAAKVIAIDPDPTQVECLRRNFAPEIAAGRVVVVPEGVWSTEGSMTLHVGEQNSGMSSLVFENGRRQVEVPITTIDLLVKELNLPSVDFLKFDIEGAEREALKGAAETLRRYKPRILLESYHREDDLEVLPRTITEIRPDYARFCGPCEYQSQPSTVVVPHYVFFE